MAREGDLAVAREAEIVRPLHFVVVGVLGVEVFGGGDVWLLAGLRADERELMMDETWQWWW
jgi:hypothetical protein